MKLGTTQPLLCLRGPGSNMVLQQLQDDHQRIKFFTAKDGSYDFLHVASIYKHVGSRTMGDGCHLPEVKVRQPAVQAAVTPTLKRFLACQDIDLDKRKIFLTSFLLSKL